MGSSVQGSGGVGPTRVQSLGLRVQGLGLGFRVESLGFRL